MCSFFLNGFPVWFNLFVFFYVTSCLLVAVHLCMDRISNKKKSSYVFSFLLNSAFEHGDYALLRCHVRVLE